MEIIFPFAESKQKLLFDKLTHELRCTVCPNQNIAESEAGLSMDLKQEIYQQVCANKNETEVIQLMQEKYGEFILYKPPFHSGTYALWLGPIILVCIAITTFLKAIKFKFNIKFNFKLSDMPNYDKD